MFASLVSRFVADVLNKTNLSFIAVADVLNETNLSFMAVADVLKLTNLSFMRVAEVLNETNLSFIKVAEVLKDTNLSFMAVADVLNETSRVSMFARDSFLNNAEMIMFCSGTSLPLVNVQFTVEEFVNDMFPQLLLPPPTAMLCTTSVNIVPLLPAPPASAAQSQSVAPVFLRIWPFKHFAPSGWISS